MIEIPTSVDETMALLERGRYVADRSLSTALFLALRLGRPLFLEGDAGVGKTEIAKVLAETLGRRLIRLQCYEGLDAAAAVYEWNYARQMMEIRLAEVAGEHDRQALARDLFSEAFLIKRPLLLALEASEGGAPVLLIDEIDRADEPFEAYLLEVLSDFQVTIPDLATWGGARSGSEDLQPGVVRAVVPPIVILTSNRTREVHDALKRRCFYHFIGYPDAARERAILKQRVPEIPEALSGQVVRFVQALRKLDLFKAPGVAETLDWANALLALDRAVLDPEVVGSTLGVLLKYQDDIAKVAGNTANQLVTDATRS